jgi:hypothetical protein
MGRTAWTDVIRNARTLGRLIWYHIPLRLSPGANANRNPQELAKVMAEKRMALDLVEACVPSSFVSLLSLASKLRDIWWTGSRWR